VTDTSAILQFVAKKLGTRVKKANCYDANVCEYQADAETRWLPVAITGHPFSQQLRAIHRNRRVHVMGNPDYIYCTVYGQLDVEQCSINRPNKISYVDQRSKVSVCGDARWPVFLCAGRQPSEKLQALLKGPAFHCTVQRLIRDSSESLHLFVDAVTLYAKPQSGGEVVDAIGELLSLVGRQVSDVNSVDFAALPSSLHSLIPLFERWAISDDGERSDLLEEASESDLSDLISTVEPHLEEIDDYLANSADGSPAAIYAGALAECAVEARLFLERLRKRNT
jgi:hypothetical protein